MSVVCVQDQGPIHGEAISMLPQPEIGTLTTTVTDAVDLAADR